MQEAYGPDPVLPKPISINELSATVPYNQVYNNPYPPPQPRHGSFNMNQVYPVNSNNQARIIQPRKKMSKSTKIVILSLVVILVVILLIAIGLIIAYALVPCSFTKCHSMAKKCVSHIFRAECQCDDGYEGDGVTYCDECGLVYFNQNARIVGGVIAVPNSWPSAVLVIFTFKAVVQIPSGVYVNLNQAYTCGGTLVDRNTVLTAAHCIQDEVEFTYNGQTYTTSVTPNSYFSTIEAMFKVYLGVHNRTSRTQSPAFEVSVKKVLRHEDYSESSKQNDIAILKLNKEVVLNKYVQITCLPNSSIPYYPTQTNIKSWAVGWGTLYSGASTSPESLYNVNLTIYDSSKCSNVLTSMSKNWNSQICAGEYSGGKDTCQGDSGGSLFVQDYVNGVLKYISVGVVSYGDGCALRGLPGIYTRTSYYRNWIKEKKWYWN